ncbi:putative phage abortive infection protein [Lactococcus lactis]|uniref:putative phage abortive infection protein n=1 Tax=Lactococcus lactis TaxID=1358 RepID=UPI00265899FC|nr:putative phage abortive infection protein [Lactococcus lactis]WKF72362.1 putative phage abortive infection protein [Lactococcus lactis]
MFWKKLWEKLMFLKKSLETLLEELWEKLKDNILRGWKNVRVRVALVILAILTSVTLLPSIAELYAVQVHLRTNPSQMNLSRSEFLKILISLISPILSYMILRNTINIQEKSLKRRDIDDVNRDFYGLIDIFDKQQQINKEKISYFYNKGIKSIGGVKDGYRSSGINPNQKNIYIYFVWSKIINQWTEKWAPGQSPLIQDKYKRVNYIINDQFDSVYFELSSYFKVLHRIMKTLNKKLEDEVIDNEAYKNYIGILRAQISSEELVIILINSLYGRRGLGLGIELVGSDLFGDKRDFELEQHFDFPKPQITNSDMGEFVLDKDNRMKDKRIELRNKLKDKSNAQALDSEMNFKMFLKMD